VGELPGPENDIPLAVELKNNLYTGIIISIQGNGER
jgi:hypothetical protein